MTMDLVGPEYNPSDRDIAISNEPDFDNEQEAQCNMRGDNNRCEINQDNDASSTLKDIGNAIGKLFNNKTNRCVFLIRYHLIGDKLSSSTSTM